MSDLALMIFMLILVGAVVWIITTEKDAVRLQARFRPLIPLMFVRLEVEILGDAEGFNAAVERICLGASISPSAR